ncbi:hypothetical protein HJG60_009994 [Phyllostomus discolor]|uniref:Uncharacterized protein n=1 Tax=Phyllostomus discolor TaxID=89673 RepID=A0A834BCV2_9CHIR|nr:hypothetical protein HJG60_009994 [Phyllostomus discolor]
MKEPLPELECSDHPPIHLVDKLDFLVAALFSAPRVFNRSVFQSTPLTERQTRGQEVTLEFLRVPPRDSNSGGVATSHHLREGGGALPVYHLCSHFPSAWTSESCCDFISKRKYFHTPVFGRQRWLQFTDALLNDTDGSRAAQMPSLSGRPHLPGGPRRVGNGVRSGAAASVGGASRAGASPRGRERDERRL